MNRDLRRRHGWAGAVRWAAAAGVVSAILVSTRPAEAQEWEPDPTASVALSLEEAVRRALSNSQEVELAESRVAIAREQVTETRAAALPQVNANFGYTRTLASVFDSGTRFELPDSLRFEPDSTRPLEERVSYLEDRVPAAALGSLGSLFGNLPFGQENAYAFTMTGSQLLYSGGRVGTALDIAGEFVAAAGLNLAEERAEIVLQVRSAYYQALLAKEAVDIAEEAMDQAERFLAEERLRFESGRSAELDVLRAEVSRDNLQPDVVEARNAQDLATLNLKRLVDLPLDQEILLTTPLDPPHVALAEVDVSDEFRLAQRAAVLAAERQVSIAQGQVSIARSSFLPDVSLSSAWGRQLFPSEVFDFGGDWRSDWTVSLNVRIPIFNGMRRFAEVNRARIALRQAELQLTQLREMVRLQHRQAQAERERALAAIQARERTAEMAGRVYDLTVLRYEEGQATQLEVQQARLDLLQARINLAQAIADFYIADAELARALAPGDARSSNDAATSPTTRVP